MRKTLLLGCFVSMCMAAGAQTLNRTMLIDFSPTAAAPNDSSKVTVNPDANGNYWNNFTNANNTAAGAALALVDKANNTTTISLKTVTDFSVNPTPGAAGLRNLSQLDVVSLGDLAIPSATTDYYYTTATGSLKFSGLTAGKIYKFYIYGCRLATDTRVSKYTFTGAATTVGYLQTSGTKLGGPLINGNNGSTYNSPFLLADANGEIKIDVTNPSSGGFSYVNAVKVEEYTPVTVTGITVAGSSISSVNGTAKMTATETQSGVNLQDLVWTVNDPKIATVSPYGVLTARKNGTVTVTASTTSGTIVSGSTQIQISNQPVPVKEMYIDFGPSDGTNGDLTAATADANGNFWNNVTANAPSGIVLPFTPVTLVDNTNAATNISVTVSAGSISTNGKANGALLTPNANYLGELGVTTATEDYFFTTSNGTLNFTGLDATKGYRFRIFGSRDNTETRIARYKFTGSNIVTGTLQSSGCNLGGIGVNTNNSGIYVSDLVYPNSSGEIALYTDMAVSGFGYINTLKLEEYSLGGTTDVSLTEGSKADILFGANQIKVKGASNCVELFNTTGTKVVSMPASAETVVNTSNLPKGIYILVVDKKQSHKLIK